MNMKLRAIALIAFLFVLTVAANAQATRADLPAPDNFLGIVSTRIDARRRVFVSPLERSLK
jgi:hypothetical protein